MKALEDIALSEGRVLLTLDTVSGSNAELLYRSLDFIASGIFHGTHAVPDTRAREHDDHVTRNLREPKGLIPPNRAWHYSGFDL